MTCLPHVTLYRGNHGVIPIARDDFDSFAEFAGEFEFLLDQEYDDKNEMIAWSPARLFDDDRRPAKARAEKPGNGGPYRHLSNVRGVSLLVIDVDRCNLEALIDAVATLNANAFLYTSPSDDPAGPPDARRARVVVEVSRPIEVSECAHTRKALAERLGLAPGAGVEGAIDAAKIFYVGRVRGTTRREFYLFERTTP